MKSIKLALLAGAAIAVSAAAAQADDLEALKAQIETLNARVAAMETAPSVPAGYSLLAVSEGSRVNTPGLEMNAQQAAAFGDNATYISVLPTADAPAGTTITWSGYARAGLVYSSRENDIEIKERTYRDGSWSKWENTKDANGKDIDYNETEDETDVFARGQLRVTASTDTAVGEVGVDMRLRANFDGIESEGSDIYMDVAWGYWSMTPELTLGGGYAGSLGNVGYGYDGACSCYYNDYGDIAFDPGDTSQMRLSYGSGPFSMGIALEDASYQNVNGWLDDSTDNQLGVAGEIKYGGDTVNGEISGVWRSVNRDDDAIGLDADFLPDQIWQIGAGIGFGLGDLASLSIGAAFGEGPFIVDTTNDGDIDDVTNWNNTWWGVSALVSANLSDEIHAELGGGYKSREFDDVDSGGYDFSGDYSTWSVAGGLYYEPVDQLTIGVEAAYWSADWTVAQDEDKAVNGSEEYKADISADNVSVDLVTVWRF